MSILLLVVCLTVGISCMCSLFESTLYSTRTAALEAAVAGQRHTEAARRMMRLRENIALPISAILVVNTIANTGGATLAGMYADQVLGPTAVPLFSLALTFAILFFAEIIPKTVGAVHWRGLWPFVGWPLSAMQFTLYPLLKLLQALTALLTRGKQPPTMTEEDILGALRLGAREGQIAEWESEMVHHIIALEEKRVREIMTPRTVLFSLDGDLAVEEAFKATAEKKFTRVPVYGAEREHIVGYVTIHDLALECLKPSSDRKLRDLVKPIAHVPEPMNCALLLTQFLRGRLHIAMVVDEYGGIAGVVTLEDLLETALGTEIVDEHDRVTDLQGLARAEGAARIRRAGHGGKSR